MLAIIGLGNPGTKYQHTRHNAGFDVIDILASLLNIEVKKIKCHALIGEGMYKGQKVLLVKPQTFMNESGIAVSEIMNYYKIETENVLVVVDDIDLIFGQVRFRKKGGAGTHNGLKSIVQYVGNGDFPRARVGVGQNKEGIDLANYVLGHYNSKEDREVAFRAYQLAAQGACSFIEKGIEKTMNEINSTNP